MFCIKCGKDATVGNFCDEHFLEKHRLFEIENFTIYACNLCGAYFDNEFKLCGDIFSVVAKLINNKISTKHKIKKIDIKLKRFGNKFLATVVCRGKIRPCKIEKLEEKKIIVTVKKRKCDNCVKQLGNYYEAVLQIRGPRKEEILKDVQKHIGKMEISSLREDGGGCNIYFINKNEARKLAKRLRKKYDVKESFKFAAEKKGKKLYRNYYAIR